MTVTVDQFIRHVSPDTPGAPDPTIRDAIVSAAIDFCERTSVWQESVPDLLVLPTVQAYELPIAADNARVHSFLSVQNHLGEPVPEVTPGYLNHYEPDWMKNRGATIKQLTFDRAQNLVRVVPVPSAVNPCGLKGILVALKPIRDTETLPAFLYEDYLEAIVYKAKETLLRMPKKAWTDISAADQFLTLYGDKVADASRHATRGMTGRSTTFSVGRNMYT